MLSALVFCQRNLSYLECSRPSHGTPILNISVVLQTLAKVTVHFQIPLNMIQMKDITINDDVFRTQKRVPTTQVSKQVFKYVIHFDILTLFSTEILEQIL